MKNLLERLRAWWRPVVEVPVEPVENPHASRGRFITHTKAPTYRPHDSYQGGRVVKVMPKQLRKIKEAQEATEDETSVTQLP